MRRRPGREANEASLVGSRVGVSNRPQMEVRQPVHRIEEASIRPLFRTFRLVPPINVQHRRALLSRLDRADPIDRNRAEVPTPLCLEFTSIHIDTPLRSRAICSNVLPSLGLMNASKPDGYPAIELASRRPAR